ncbi:serine/threonine-protein kinase [Microbacterium karelineae]|uniref:serine/threonine-protein kinase n=1 Tax=Microbacterium karelineae TaxID=2654283 RepID=UPI0012EA7048|nr:serine/threonine-protein kinase [Microbacterium karelineae]
MTRRAPSDPPELPGFTYLQLLGSGGFADVFLYEQKMPRRRVAIKVLLSDRISTSAAQFTAEANVMAMLSTHPAIVAVYQAGVADDGRPYLVMEYCPRPNLQVRYRREPFSVEEALHTGIPVAAAVETAHRANVLHRDIKPANILVTEYNRPALTDFGIASSTAQPGESQGVSVPWSPPEAFLDPPRSDVRSDVYQLGATIYTLLSGRSPFEVAGGDNGSATLIERISSLPLPDLQRRDVPRSLSVVLERAMAKDARDRFGTAAAFARALQKVQIELGHQVTQIDILDDGDEPHDEASDDDGIGVTRIRRLSGTTTVMPDDPAEAIASPESAPFAPLPPAPDDPFVIPAAGATGDHAEFAPPAPAGDDGAVPAWAADPAPAPSTSDSSNARDDADGADPAGNAAPSRTRRTAAEQPAADDGPPVIDDATVVRPPAAGPVDDTTIAAPPVAAPVDDATVVRPPAAAPVDDATAPRRSRRADPGPADYEFVSRVEIRRGSVPTADTSTFRVASRVIPLPGETRDITRTHRTASERRSRRGLVIGGIIAGAALLAGIAALLVFLITQTADDPDESGIPDRDVPAVTQLRGAADGDEVTFSWSNPDPRAGDAYRWGIYEDDRLTSLESETSETSITLDTEPGETTCIEVLLERDDGARSTTEVACVDAAG